MEEWPDGGVECFGSNRMLSIPSEPKIEHKTQETQLFWMAVIFQYGNDPGKVVGIYDSQEKAVQRIKAVLDPSNRNDDLMAEHFTISSDVGFALGKPHEEVVGQAILMTVNRDEEISV